MILKKIRIAYFHSFLLILGLFIGVAFGEGDDSFEIAGYVITSDGNSQNIIVQLSLDGSNYNSQTNTDKDGFFIIKESLDNMILTSSTKPQLKFSKEGYVEKHINLNITDDDLNKGKYLISGVKSLKPFFIEDDNPCKGRYLELLTQIRSGDLTSWVGNEREEWQTLNKRCMDYERSISDSLIAKYEDSIKIANENRFIFEEQEKGNPCYDSKYLTLKVKEFDDMSDREWNYFLLKEKQCGEYKTSQEASINPPIIKNNYYGNQSSPSDQRKSPNSKESSKDNSLWKDAGEIILDMLEYHEESKLDSEWDRIQRNVSSKDVCQYDDTRLSPVFPSVSKFESGRFFKKYECGAIFDKHYYWLRD